MTENPDDLFSALHHTHCSACQREEPSSPIPGRPLNGKFVVLRRVKLCLKCCRELRVKLDALGVNVMVDAQT